MKAVLASAALLAFLAIACQGGEEAAPALTATPAVSRSPTSAAPSATPEAEREPRLVLLRPAPGLSGQGAGVIHLSGDLAGSNIVQLTPGDVRASFVGLAERDGTTVLYYIAAGELRNVFTLEARDLSTGETTTLATIEPTEHGELQEASLSPDGRYVAWSHPDSIDLIDLTSNDRRRILTSNYGACGVRPPEECYGYETPTWSPDGRLLLVAKFVYEVIFGVVVDPFQPTPQVLGGSSSGDPLPAQGAWSSTSDAWCGGYGHYDAPSGLYVSEEPEWQPRNLLPEYETYDPDTSGRYAADCVWLDEQRIAFSTWRPDPQASNNMVSIYDLTTAAVTDLVDFGQAVPQLFLVPGSSTLVFNEINGENLGQPGLLDTTDGTRTPILQPGDRIVAVTQPVALPEEIAAVTPKLMPCVPLAAHCEAQVTSEAQRLNIREGLSQESDVMGRLSEGEIVCLAGRSRFGEDGFRWWPIASWSGTGGWWWVAQGDPQEPERPWLTPTGRRCEE